MMGQFWTKLFRQRDIRILLLGLDAAGKTTILYRLKLGEVVSHIPTIGFNVETLQYKDMNFTAWDIGSRDKMRPLFRHYYKGSDAVVIVIDSSDRERIDELNHDVIKPALMAEELAHSVFLFLANKKDLPNTMSGHEITERLHLRHLKHTWTLVETSAIDGDGLVEAMDWLAFQLGTSQSRKLAVTSPVSVPAERPASETGTKLEHVHYCTRAYSAIKCLFFRTNTHESED